MKSEQKSCPCDDDGKELIHGNDSNGKEGVEDDEKNVNEKEGISFGHDSTSLSLGLGNISICFESSDDDAHVHFEICFFT